MIQVIFLSFREYFEAFLLITGFSLLCYQYGLKRTREIVVASLLAFLLSLSVTIYVLATGATFLQETRLDYLEGWLLLTSSILITFFAFPFHKFIWKNIEAKMPTLETRVKDQTRSFDWILFMFVFLLVLKEGAEALVFTSGVSLSTSTNSIENIVGLIFGFFFATGLAFVLRASALYAHIEKVFSTMAFLILFGMATLFQEGLEKVTGLPYELTVVCAAFYAVIVYALFISKKEISNKS